MDRPAVVQCQQCKAQLQIISSAPSCEAPSPPPQPSAISSRLDESFFLLEGALSGRHAHSPGPSTPEGGMEESFVVLQQTNPAPPASPPSTQAQSQQQRFSVDDKMRTLANVLELASEETDLDHPLCADCAAEVVRELTAQAEELEAEVAAYASLEAQLVAAAAAAEEGRGPSPPLSERAFQREVAIAREEVEKERARLVRAEFELAAAESRAAAADAAVQQLSDIESQYWHAFHAVVLALHAATDYRDSLQQRVDAAERSIVSLRRTNVLSDLFHISWDGPFGTISGLRLGSTPQTPVEWWEINAAWGQATMLLETLTRALGISSLRNRLDPRGSYSRVVDSRGAAELFGPASKLVCPSFDRAQVGYLACLKELGEALTARGAVDAGKPFALPYPIDGDRVGGYSIRYGLSRDKAWTKALKYTLSNLKFCLKGTLMLMDVRRKMEALPREGPGGVGLASLVVP